MSTFVYMVRHGDSPKEGSYRTRGLTEKGYLDAQRVTYILKDAKSMQLFLAHTYVQY